MNTILKKSTRLGKLAFVGKTLFAWVAIGFFSNAHAATLDASNFSLAFALPLLGLLLTMALMPLVAVHFWHRNDGKIVSIFAIITILGLLYEVGFSASFTVIIHTIIFEYIPFVVLVSTLYIVTGGIHIAVPLKATPFVNTGILLLGSLLASVIGTTGATMLFIRPLLKINKDRTHKVHVFIFFIILVANIGGALTPIGDPPLFVGFLKGVDFFWTLQHLLPLFSFMVGSILLLFFIVDSVFFKIQKKHGGEVQQENTSWGFWGAKNVVILVLVNSCVIISGFWESAPVISFFAGDLKASFIFRDVSLILLSTWSLLSTPRDIRASNHFTWYPVKEVMTVFAAIFICLAPVQAMLQAGANGPFADLMSLVNNENGVPLAFNYFWITGILSGFLDNAPTYLLFFNLAGGDAGVLMTTLSYILVAISAAAVFMGAISYIGNAPNLMAKSVIEHSGIKMPSFLVYTFWALLILVPNFLILSKIFF